MLMKLHHSAGEFPNDFYYGKWKCKSDSFANKEDLKNTGETDS